MSEEAAGEKTFAPTPKKLRDAANKGDVLRSRELATAAGLMTGTAWLIFFAPQLLHALLGLTRSAFTFDRGNIENFGGVESLEQTLGLLVPIAVLGLVVSAASVISQIAFGDGRWVPANLNFKASRLNPLSGIKRMFGPNGLIEMGKGLLKVFLLGSIAAWWAIGSLDDLIGMGRLTLAAMLLQSWQMIVALLTSLCLGLLAIAAVDLPTQWIRRTNRLKMSQQEMKDEHKQAEGSPEARSARRQRQRDIATGAIAGAMRGAQFIVTNPAHFSVALTYDPAIASAPVVVAKGRGDKALAIRELAAEYEIPVLEYPVLARALYFTTRERQVIREELYAAVAMIVAFVLSIRRGEQPLHPTIQVPVTMQFDAEGRLAA